MKFIFAFLVTALIVGFIVFAINNTETLEDVGITVEATIIEVAPYTSRTGAEGYRIVLANDTDFNERVIFYSSFLQINPKNVLTETLTVIVDPRNLNSYRVNIGNLR
jgi:predicted amino acid racemase